VIQAPAARSANSDERSSIVRATNPHFRRRQSMPSTEITVARPARFSGGSQAALPTPKTCAT
jgi:hypothetical protein